MASRSWLVELKNMVGGDIRLVVFNFVTWASIFTFLLWLVMTRHVCIVSYSRETL
jgi:hypothetical protein